MSHNVPDFKSRLTRLRKNEGKKIPGFGKVNRQGRKDEKITIPIPGLDRWFEDNQALLEELDNTKVP